MANETNLSVSNSAKPSYGFEINRLEFLPVVNVLACGIANSFVIGIVLRKFRKTSNLLIAHLAFISILFPIAFLFPTVERTGPLYTMEELCSGLAYAKGSLQMMHMFTLVSITYDRVHMLLVSEDCFKIFHFLGIIWSLSLTLSVPSAFTTVSAAYYKAQDGASSNISTSKTTCIPVNLLDSRAATFVYELGRLMCVVGVGSYMLFAVLKIRALITRLRRVRGITTERMSRKLRSVRLIYFIFTTFVFLAVIANVQVFYRRLIARHVFEAVESPVILQLLWSQYAFLFYVGSCLYFFLMPLVSLYMLEGKAIFVRNTPVCTNDVMALPEHSQDIHTSRMSTVNFSSHEESKEKPVEQLNVGGESSRFGLFNPQKEV